MSMKIDTSHGSPYDRGGADFYYGRARRPHKTNPIRTTNLTPEEVAEYHRGYDEAEEFGEQKDFR